MLRPLAMKPDARRRVVDEVSRDRRVGRGSRTLDHETGVLGELAHRATNLDFGHEHEVDAALFDDLVGDGTVVTAARKPVGDGRTVHDVAHAHAAQYVIERRALFGLARPSREYRCDRGRRARAACPR